jgi:FKBP-type peptidyl-prolyl cis-trans isomerase
LKEVQLKKYSSFVLVGVLIAFASGCTKKENQTGSQQTTGAPTQSTTAGELKKEDLVVGKGAEAAPGKKVSVHYTGWLTDGKEFDSSKKSGHPFEFTLGEGKVIKGWDDGLVGMKVGGKRKLTIPPQLAYGERAVGGVIPANSTLVFEVELLNVK